MKKLYVIVSSKLSKSQQAVQAAHVVAQYCIDFPESKWNNSTLVILKDRDPNEYILEADAAFVEPYYNNLVTAVARYGEDLYPHLRMI